MDYADMIIEAADAQLVRTPDKQRLGQFKVRVLSSPAGEMRPEESVPVSYDDRQLQASLQQLDSRALDRSGLVALGRALALLLLPPKQAGAATGVRDLLAASLAEVGVDGGLRLRLRLPAMLAPIPWEYVYVERAGGGEGMDGFLALDPRVAIVRHEALAALAPAPLTGGPIKVVAALASAEGLPPLDLARERADLEQALGGQPGIEPLFLPDATLDELQAALPGAEIFHFAGHGTFNRQVGDLPGTYTGSGALALYDQPVDAEQLGVNLRGSGVRLAVLGGCETGRRDGVSVWSGVAPALVKAEIPAVVANQFPIRDDCAIAFGKHFYQALVGGMSIERAVAAGRLAAYNADKDGRDWGVPVLYLRAADGRLFGGAADAGVREQARAGAHAVIDVHVGQLGAGGEVLGAQGKVGAGTLAVTVKVGTAIDSDISGAQLTMTGGEAHVQVDVEQTSGDVDIVGGRIEI